MAEDTGYSIYDGDKRDLDLTMSCLQGEAGC